MRADDQRYHRPRVAAIERLMVQHGFTRDSLAEKAGTSINTLRKRLNGEPALMCTFNKLAKALHTTPDMIIEGYEPEPDIPAPPPAREQPDVFVSKKFADFDEGEELQELISRFKKLVRAKFKVVVIAIDDGSVRLGLSMATDDIMRLIDAFAARRLDQIGVISVRLPPSRLCQRRAEKRMRSRSRLFNTIITIALLIAVLPSAFAFAVAQPAGLSTIPLWVVLALILLRSYFPPKPRFSLRVDERGDITLSRPDAPQSPSRQ